MSSRHASLGRRTLEDIRQKRAAERLSKASSGPDLSKVPSPTDGSTIRKSESANRLSETDIGALYSQLKELEKQNADIEEKNKILSLKLQTKEVENKTLQTQLNELEQNTVPSLRKALKDVAMEKDAAVVLREDLSAQLRTLKKRFKDAEDEQYRAEEDAAALRAELNSIQQQAISGSLGGFPQMGIVPDQIQNLEQELATVKFELKKNLSSRQQEQQQIAEAHAQISSLLSEKQELEKKLSDMSESVSGAGEKAGQRGLSLEDKENLEKQLHDMAVALERLETSRQKLLTEIDNQSSEIERLFEENSNLSSSYHEAINTAKQWEDQVKDCLKQNEELRGILYKLRMEQVSSSSVKDFGIQRSTSGNHADGADETEVFTLKGDLVKEQSRAEELSAQVLQLSAQVQQATQAYNALARCYKPVFRNIESSLLKLKQEGSVTAQ